MKTKSHLKHFLALCSRAQSQEELEELFGLFLTPEEEETLGKRCLVIKALLEGSLSQRKIAKKFHVSISQITRGSNALKRISSKLQKSLSCFWAPSP